MLLNDILNALARQSRALEAQAEKLAAERDYSAEFPACDAEALRAAHSMLCRMASGNPAGTPGAKVDASRLSPDLPPPFDSQEEAQRAASIWPQEAEPATVRVSPKAQGDDAYRDVPFTHHPRSGLPLQDRMTRRACTLRRWDFNPWTGAERQREDVASDPEGLTLRPPGWPVFAVKKPSALDEMAAQAAIWVSKAASERVMGASPALGAPYGVDFKNHQWIGIAIDHATKWKTAGGLQNLLMAKHYLDKLIELEGKAS